MCKLKEFYSEDLFIHYLDSTINILLFCSILYLSTPPFTH